MLPLEDEERQFDERKLTRFIEFFFPSAEAPDCWHWAFPHCLGSRQSPINIQTANVVADRTLPPLKVVSTTGFLHVSMSIRATLYCEIVHLKLLRRFFVHTISALLDVVQLLHAFGCFIFSHKGDHNTLRDIHDAFLQIPNFCSKSR